MALHFKPSLIISFSKRLMQFAILLAIVLWINSPIISSDFFYPEQPTIYLANQKILSFHDLLNVYLHPQWLQLEIPFFRPSGHFLIYQLMAPLFGWHNVQAFLVLNFVFLALIGFMLIANYKLLFPKLEVGAYIAFAIFLMHPALSLSRFTILHFEFAYPFFLLLGLYCFLLFCKKNSLYETVNISKIRFHHFYLLALTLFFYILATTFKEPAIILGPMLISYFFLILYKKQNPLIFLSTIYKNLQIRQLFQVLILSTLVLAIYLTFPWPAMHHPLRPVVLINSYGAMNELINAFLGTNIIFFKNGFLVAAALVWRSIAFPSINFYLMQLSLIIFTLGCSTLFIHPAASSLYKKSFIFLIISFLLSLVLPIAWAVGGPWHLNLSILFFSMLAGFSIEYLSQFLVKNKRYVYFGGLLLALMIASTGIETNKANLQAYQKKEGIIFAMSLNKNAVLHPPALKDKLNADSLLIVEDSIIHNDYSLGNAAYPFLLFLNDKEYPNFARSQDLYFMKFNLSYSGTLFHWAYLMPALQEELYPFSVNKMNEIPNEIIYDWLKHFNNIFCVGYDEQANWHDLTNIFKRNLLIEKERRNIVIHDYQVKADTAFRTSIILKKTLSIPDQRLCEYTCDQDKNCKAFTYRDIGFDRKICELYQFTGKKNQITCRFCTSFIKIS